MPTKMLLTAVAVFIAFASATSGAQAPAAAPARPDSPQITAMIEKTRKAAGPMWADEVHFFCEAPRANSADDPPIEPTKIFDNVYAIGNAGTTVYVIQTSAGLLMIDSMAGNQLETQLLPGFMKLGLDPAQVKVIVLGHGHADHFGGSPYFQQKFGTRVYLSEPDWQTAENTPAPRGGGPRPTPPKRDGVMVEGQPVVLGDLKVVPVSIPGHTPGSMGFIFPVKDNGRTRMAALYGGTILTPGPISDEGLATYRKSVAHFKEETRKAKVEVEIQNHPLMDPILPKLARLAARKPGQPNPFVVGEDNYQKFLDVIGACTDVNIARRKQS
jgi:metallo-beta-lactamase class B